MNTPGATPDRGNMTHVVAGDMEQFHRYLDNRQIPRHHGRYVVGPIDLAGLPEGTKVILTGTYFHKNNWATIEEAIKQYGLMTHLDSY